MKNAGHSFRHDVLRLLLMSNQQSQNQKLVIYHHKKDKDSQQILTFKNQEPANQCFFFFSQLSVFSCKLLAFIFLWSAAHKHTVYPVVSLRYHQTAQIHLFHFTYLTLFASFFCNVYLDANQGGSVCALPQQPAGSGHATQLWVSKAGKSNQLRTQPRRFICELCFYFPIKCGRSVYSFGMRV